MRRMLWDYLVLCTISYNNLMHPRPQGDGTTRRHDATLIWRLQNTIVILITACDTFGNQSALRKALFLPWSSRSNEINPGVEVESHV